MKLAYCRSCGKQVQWVVTEKGKRMPVDMEPVDGGNIILREVKGREPTALYAKPDPQLKRYVSHFVTCPSAAQWRKKGGKRGSAET